MSTTSPTLLHRVRNAADNAAWKQFVNLYTPLLAEWCQAAGLSEADTADLIQEVLLLLMRKLPDFDYDGQKTFRGWLRTVTINKWRSLQRKRREQQLGSDDGRLRNLPDESAVMFWERDYQQYLMNRALELMRDNFDPNTWKACLLSVSTGRTAADVAQELGMSTASVFTARSRVLKRLREELDGLLD
ncbi:MAG: RNA polymerase sigma factor [Pirellulales bacterium]